MEKAGDYMIRMIEKMYKEDLRSFCVKDKVVEEFTAYSDAWMPRSVCELNSIVLSSDYCVLTVPIFQGLHLADPGSRTTPLTVACMLFGPVR